MKVLFNRQCLLFTVAVILTVYTFSASAVPAKDHKKKLLEKLRNSLNQTEVEEAAAAADVPLELDAAPAENVTADANPEVKGEEEEEGKDEKEEREGDAGAVEVTKEEKKSDSAEKAESTELATKQEGTSSYLLKMRTVLKRIFDMFGFRQSKKKEGRQNRMLSNDDSYSYNGLEYEFFKDDIRTTVGAVLGEKECIQKIVCGAGSYLRDVNGKHLILTVLENVTPSAWMETMDLLKKSAVTNGDCTYKCLESDDAI